MSDVGASGGGGGVSYSQVEGLVAKGLSVAAAGAVHTEDVMTVSKGGKEVTFESGATRR